MQKKWAYGIVFMLCAGQAVAQTNSGYGTNGYGLNGINSGRGYGNNGYGYGQNRNNQNQPGIFDNKSSGSINPIVPYGAEALAAGSLKDTCPKAADANVDVNANANKQTLDQNNEDSLGIINGPQGNGQNQPGIFDDTASNGKVEVPLGYGAECMPGQTAAEVQGKLGLLKDSQRAVSALDQAQIKRMASNLKTDSKKLYGHSYGAENKWGDTDIKPLAAFPAVAPPLLPAASMPMNASTPTVPTSKIRIDYAGRVQQMFAKPVSLSAATRAKINSMNTAARSRFEMVARQVARDNPSRAPTEDEINTLVDRAQNQ